MSHIARNGTSAYIGLPEREASKLQDLWQRDEVGLELSVEVHAPVVVGIYPMRIARFVLDQASGLNGHANGNGVHPHGSARPRRSGADRRRGRMKVAAVLTDLMTYSRIESAARASGVELARVDRPADAPSDADLVLVDWSARRPGWTEALRAHAGRVILFGPHTDLAGACGRSERRLGADVGALEADGRAPARDDTTRRT